MNKIKSYKELQTGDLLHRHSPFVWYKPTRYLSVLIRFFTKSWSGHTAMIIDIWSEKMVVESDGLNVRLLPYKEWAKDSLIIITRNELTEFQKRHLSIVAISKQGYTGYDFIGIIHQLIFQLSGQWIGRTGDNASKKMYCSEYIAWCYNEVLRIYPNWFKIAPSDLYNDNKFFQIYKGIANNLIN